MGAAALDPAPSAGVCRDGSDLALQSFVRTIDVAMICRSIRIPGRLSTSGRGSRTSAAGSRRSDTFPRSSAGVPRQPLGVRKRSRSARESSEADRLHSVRVPRHGCTLSAPARKLRSCSCRASQAVPRIPAPFRARSGRFREDLCGDLPAGRRSLSGDHPLAPAQHVGGLCVCFRVRRCAPFWPSPARFAAGVGSSMPASASRRCASFWAPPCAFLSSGRMHERDLWPYLPRCGRSGAAVRVLRRWRLSYIPRRDQRAVRHLRVL